MYTVKHDSKISLSVQIYQQVIDQIKKGIYQKGDKLISSRKLANELGVSRNTVLNAYEQLLAEGYITSIVGSGYLVNEIEPPIVKEPSSKYLQPIPNKKKYQYKYSFSYSTIDPNYFPYDNWRKSMNSALELMQDNYEEYLRSEDCLKQSLRNYLYHSRGVDCDLQQIIITTGHQHALDIIASIIDDKQIVLEDPGYEVIKNVFDKYNYDISYLNVVDDGIDVNNLETLNKKLICVTPSHQYPTGSVLPINKRTKLINWANKNNAYIIEDDYDSELRYYTNPIPSLFSMDNSEHTIYTGSFSKILSPTLRFGYLVLPKNLLDKYHNVYKHYNYSVPLIIQRALSHFIEEGFLQKHINKMRTTYKSQQNEMLQALKEVFKDNVKIIGDMAGLHFLVEINCKYNSEQLVALAKKIDIEIFSPSKMYYDKTNYNNHLIILGYSLKPQNITYQQIFKELYNCWNI